MAIRPQQCLTLTSDESRLVTHLELQMDKALKDRWFGSPVRIGTGNVALPQRVVAELIRSYTRVGWRIVYAMPQNTTQGYFELQSKSRVETQRATGESQASSPQEVERTRSIDLTEPT